MNSNQYFYVLLSLLLSVFIQTHSFSQRFVTRELSNEYLKLAWQDSDSGFTLKQVQINTNSKWEPLSERDINRCRYTVLYAKTKPTTDRSVISNRDGSIIHFPEPEYRFVSEKWMDATTPVSLNRAGFSYSFFPKSAELKENSIVFKSENAVSASSFTWTLDNEYKHDALVTISVKAKEAGYFSIETPSLIKGDVKDFQWGIIPGILQGKSVNENFVNAYAYGHGIPNIPIVARERTASALTSILTNKNGVSVAVTAEPGTGRDPWLNDKLTHKDWLLGLSLMNRQATLTPTLYHPILGEIKSYLNAGDSISFSFRYTIQKSDWYTVYKHVVTNIYQFNDYLNLKKTKESLSSRIERLFDYVKSDSTSKWINTEYNDLTIGAQAYLGGVFESTKKDAMKNADYGAMWMLANVTKDSILREQRLPYALNFKIAQQNLRDSFFYGAAAGQYYLYDSKRFTEEWGPYTEPIATTYYLICDIANVLVFEPDQPQLKKELTLAANWLLRTMKTDGSWEIAYSNTTYKPMFGDQKDYRPTFYGLLVAYHILKDKKYLNAAIKGSDWFLKNAVDNGYFLGVCGDTRFAPDFATAQSAQALLELYDVTKQIKYKEAAIKVARMYTTSIYSHPIPSRSIKEVKGRKLQDWEISQVGLGFEHGGAIGSANNRGPILLASHAGMFVRFFGLTGDSLFLNMARAAAWGRDAFVDPATGVASYYWNAMNNGAGPYPHHAWWQIGWLTDYLISEATLRSNGQVVFPQGFITPKVGPHLTYGFGNGTVFGTAARMFLKKEFVSADNPYIENITAVSADSKYYFIILLNNSEQEQEVSISVDPSKISKSVSVKKAQAEYYNKKWSIKEADSFNKYKLKIKPCGIDVLRVKIN